MNPRIMYITNNNLCTILKHNNISERTDKHSAEEKIKGVLKAAFEESGAIPDEFEQLKNAAKLAIESVQYNINHGGGIKNFSASTLARLGTNKKAIKLFYTLIQDNRNDLEITSAHRWHFLGNRKLSFIGTNYTYTNQKLNKFIDQYQQPKVNFPSTIPDKFNAIILDMLSTKDQLTFSHLNSSARNLWKTLGKDPLVNLKLKPTLISNRRSFDEFCNYLASSECRTTSLNLNSINFIYSKGAFRKLIAALEHNNTVTTLTIAKCSFLPEEFFKLGRIVDKLEHLSFVYEDMKTYCSKLLQDVQLTHPILNYIQNTFFNSHNQILIEREKLSSKFTPFSLACAYTRIILKSDLPEAKKVDVLCYKYSYTIFSRRWGHDDGEPNEVHTDRYPKIFNLLMDQLERVGEHVSPPDGPMVLAGLLRLIINSSLNFNAKSSIISKIFVNDHSYSDVPKAKLEAEIHAFQQVIELESNFTEKQKSILYKGIHSFLQKGR